MADDLAELSRKMKLIRKQDEWLLDIDDITAKVSTGRPVGCKSKRTFQGECCCQEHCNLAMHISSQVKLTIYQKEAILMREVAQSESDDEELIKCGGGIFSRADFDVVTKIMASSMAPLAHALRLDQQIIQTYPELYRAKPLIKSIMDSE